MEGSFERQTRAWSSRVEPSINTMLGIMNYGIIIIIYDAIITVLYIRITFTNYGIPHWEGRKEGKKAQSEKERRKEGTIWRDLYGISKWIP